jgi:hypothetical protein
VKPAILTDCDDDRLSWLVDSHRTAIHYEPTTGERLVHYETAVNLQDLTPGQYRLHINPANQAGEVGFAAQPLGDWAEVWELGFVSPRPCVYAVKNHKRHRETSFAMGRVSDLLLPAAVTLLRLAAAFNNVTACSLRERFSFNPERVEHPEGMPPDSEFIAWNPWAYHIAWHWSAWEKMGVQRGKRLSIQERFNLLKAFGYPHGLKAFERMHGALFPKRKK